MSCSGSCARSSTPCYLDDSEPPFSCVDCEAGFDTLKESEEHQCPLGTKMNPVNLTLTTPPPSPTGSSILQEGSAIQSLEFPELPPFTTAGDSSRITCLRPAVSSGMNEPDAYFWATQFNSGRRTARHIMLKYQYMLWKSPDLKRVAANISLCVFSVTDQVGAEEEEPVTWSYSSTLVGPAITVHAVLSSAARAALRPVSPTALLAFATCLEDLGSYISLALTLSRTRSEEAEYLTRVVSVSLPTSIDFESFLASLTRVGAVKKLGCGVLSDPPPSRHYC